MPIPPNKLKTKFVLLRKIILKFVSGIFVADVNSINCGEIVQKRRKKNAENKQGNAKTAAMNEQDPIDSHEKWHIINI